MSFVYSSSQQVKAEYRKLLKTKNLTMKQASELLEFSTPQQLNNKFNNKRLSLDDLNKFLDVIGCEFEINFKDK